MKNELSRKAVRPQAGESLHCSFHEDGNRLWTTTAKGTEPQSLRRTLHSTEKNMSIRSALGAFYRKIPKRIRKFTWLLKPTLIGTFCLRFFIWLYQSILTIKCTPVAEFLERWARRNGDRVVVALRAAAIYSAKRGWQTEARRWYQRIFEFTGGHPRAAGQLAAAYELCGDIDSALRFWRLAINAYDPDAYGMYCQAELKNPSATNASLLEIHRSFAKRFARAPAQSDFHHFPAWGERRPLRVGISCGFWAAATIRNQFLCWIRSMDRTAFQIFFYVSEESTHPWLEAYADVVRNTSVKEITRDDFVALVRNDGIDVFVELSGFSPGNRLMEMAQRCAPVQVSYLNHSATSGVPNVDYVIADRWCIPQGEERFYTEEIYRLPRSFFCFNFDEENFPVSHIPPSATAGRMTFGFFGSPSKFNPVFISLLAKVLRAVPGSRLCMANAATSCPQVRADLIAQFESLGVAANRLNLARNQDRRGVAELHRVVDISLDSWPYCGGNTLAESLWYGVPAITLRGSRFSANYGSSLLAACGLEDLIAHSEDEYVQIAMRLAADAARLARIRKTLRNEMCRKNGFSDTAAFAREFGVALREMRGRANRLIR